MRRSQFALMLLLSAVTLPAYAADAPAPQPTRLLTEPLTGLPDKQVVMVDVTWGPDAALGPHTHPGDEYGTVISGEFTVRTADGAWRTLKAGESFHNNAGVVHEGKNDGKEPARTIQTYVVEAGQPLTTMQKK
ncbi:MAG: cupin protein [Rhodospirillales bacterium]|jgi:quercetin dioxygenase-like cupin family protein|nr:cupin protein [Rhodospirillales bacterium]